MEIRFKDFGILFSAKLILVLSCSGALAQESSEHIQARIINTKQDLQTTMSSHILHFSYNAEDITYYKPEAVSDDKTTALVHSRNIKVRDQITGETSPHTRQTSYSAELGLGYETKYHTVDAWVSRSRDRIIHDFNSTTPPSYAAGSLSTTSTLAGTGRLVLTYDGNKSRGLMQSQNIRSGIIKNSGLEKDGDAIRFSVLTPLHAWAMPSLSGVGAVQHTPAGITFSKGKNNSTYTLLPQYGYALGSMVQRSKKLEIETLYSDFAPVAATALMFPKKIIKILRETDGFVISKTTAHLHTVEFVHQDAVDPHTFQLDYPAGTDFSENNLLRGAMMGTIPR